MGGLFDGPRQASSAGELQTGGCCCKSSRQVWTVSGMIRCTCHNRTYSTSAALLDADWPWLFAAEFSASARTVITVDQSDTIELDYFCSASTYSIGIFTLVVQSSGLMPVKHARVSRIHCKVPLHFCT